MFPFMSFGLKIMLICFDFDGVLANTASTKFSLFKKAGYEFLPNKYQNEYLEFLEKNPNTNRSNKLSYISNKSGKDIEDLILWFKKSLFSKKPDLFKPNSKFLEKLKLHKTAIVSAAPLEDLITFSSSSYLKIFSSEGIFYDCKDKSFELLKLKTKLKYKIKRFVFIGDTPSDMKSAEKANFEFIPFTKWSCYDWPDETYTNKLCCLNNLFENKTFIK